MEVMGWPDLMDESLFSASHSPSALGKRAQVPP